jgi:type I restriction enzyme M protein
MPIKSITRKQIFSHLTLARSRELLAALELEGFTGLNKAALIDKLSRKSSLKPEAVLNALKRDELKALCELQELDTSGREKQPFIDRLLGEAPAQPHKVAEKPAPYVAPQKDKPARQPKQKSAMFEQTFNNLDNVLRQEAGCTTELDYTEQTSWMLFLKYLDDLEWKKKQEAELQGKKYHYIIDEAHRWSVWAAPKNEQGEFDHDNAISGPDLIKYIDEQLFPYLKGFKQRAESADTIEYKIGEIFGELKNRFTSGYSLRDALELIDALRFRSQKEKHELSHLYEAKIKNMGNAGRNGGEYYTPRPLIRAMIKVVKPTIGERIYDGACGSAGFLCEAYDYLRYEENGVPRQGLTTSDLKKLQQSTFYGREKKGLAYVIAIMNMILHGIEAPNIIHTNTLANHSDQVEEKDRHHVILANPPFGGKERKELQQNFTIRSGETAFLFLQHFIKQLKAGGRAAVVIKNTFLSNTDNASIALRKELLESSNLHTVLDMPGGTFQGAGVKTVILFFNKGAPTRKVAPRCFKWVAQTLVSPL